MDNFFTNSDNIILVGKVLILILAGVLVGYLVKHLAKRGIDSFILKKLFKKDVSTYETSLVILRVFAEIIQWTIILAVANYALIMLNFYLLSQAFSWIVSKIPQIIVFIAIISGGLLIAKFVSGKIMGKELAGKEEISFVTEIVIVAAFTLTALEFVGLKATALVELYKVVLYMVAIVIIIILVKPEIFKKVGRK